MVICAKLKWKLLNFREGTWWEIVWRDLLRWKSRRSYLKERWAWKVQRHYQSIKPIQQTKEVTRDDYTIPSYQYTLLKVNVALSQREALVLQERVFFLFLWTQAVSDLDRVNFIFQEKYHYLLILSWRVKGLDSQCTNLRKKKTKARRGIHP